MKVGLNSCHSMGWNFELSCISSVSYERLFMATHLLPCDTFRYLKQSQDRSPAQPGNVLPANKCNYCNYEGRMDPWLLSNSNGSPSCKWFTMISTGISLQEETDWPRSCRRICTPGKWGAPPVHRNQGGRTAVTFSSFWTPMGHAASPAASIYTTVWEGQRKADNHFFLGPILCGLVGKKWRKVACFYN